MPMVVGCSILLLALLLVVLQGNKKGLVTIQKGPKPNEVTDNVTPVVKTDGANKAAASAIDPMLEFFSIQSDASNVPWTPPSVGAPYSTEMLPPGLEAVLFLKQEIVAGEESASNSVSALSSWWSSVYPSSKSSGAGGLPEFGFVATDAFNTVAVGWYPGASVGTYHNVLRWSRKDPGPLSSMLNDLESWKSNTLDVGSKKYRYWTKDSEGRSYAAVTDDFSSQAVDQVKRLTIGPIELLKPMFESEGKSGPLRRQLDSLLQSTDSRADVTFLAAPSFLFGDGKEWLGEQSGKVREAMREIVDDRVQALLCRVHFEPEFYVEYRTLGNDLQSASRDAVDLRKKLAEAADAVESQLTAQPAASYWRPIANRFPQMLRALHKYSRSGAEDGQVVFNAYLPKESAVNLAIGSWMALQVGSDVALSGAGKTKAGSEKPTTTSTAPKTAPKSIDDLLATKVKLRIEQESLEVVLQAIATELKESQSVDAEPIPMAINGTAFQKDGITRNQQIRNFDYTDTPVRDLLTALVRRANPVTTVQNPNEKDQKVVWLLLDDPDSPAKKKLELTTRAWAEGNNAALPKEFELPTP